ncbi:hypothetical protein C8R48DRAFT_443744 [Suillus tomentosus]|nr:hypothetical protein C8R48DRAFT_443744 [Suillus tomentosus]
MTGSKKYKGRGKGSGRKKTPNVTSSQSKDIAILCSTLEEDETTCCDQPPTEGFERCEVHQAQYRTMYKKHKDASKVVDDIKSGTMELPTKEQIQCYTDLHLTLNKARLVRKYLESIRVERTGRGMHQRRFFLKIDDGHKDRLKFLEKKMRKAVDVLSNLQARALNLHIVNKPGSEWIKPVQSPNDFDDEPISTERIIEAAQRTLPKDRKNSTCPLSASKKSMGSSALADEDLIDLEHRAQKTQILHTILEMITDPDLFTRDLTSSR